MFDGSHSLNRVSKAWRANLACTLAEWMRALFSWLAVNVLHDSQGSVQAVLQSRGSAG
jgi:hypothetical protein